VKPFGNGPYNEIFSTSNEVLVTAVIFFNMVVPWQITLILALNCTGQTSAA
jgi:hypothetical protein